MIHPTRLTHRSRSGRRPASPPALALLVATLVLLALLAPALVLPGAAVPVAFAQASPLLLGKADTVQALLERNVGKRVELVLVSGEKLDGTVKTVGSDLVELAGLQGREFFSAVVRIDRIDAVIGRTRTR